jgi:flagellar hook-associated protein 3 FlgL
MRVSTQMIFDSGATRMGDMQTALNRTREQIASGRRMLAPSDDPVSAARAVEVAQAQALNERLAVNRQRATAGLTEAEGVLASVTELIQNVKVTVNAAGNGLLDDSSRAAMATELQARYDLLLGYANSRDASGNYIFSGFSTDTPAFDAAGAYQGDGGKRLLQVDSARQMEMNIPGDKVFQGGGQDLFQTLNDLIALLNTPGMPSATTLTAHNAALTDALDNVSTVRASLGTRLQELEQLDYAGDDRKLQYAQVLSELQDLDYTEALTRLSQQEFVLQAAQQSFAKTASLSLFDYIR